MTSHANDNNTNIATLMLDSSANTTLDWADHDAESSMFTSAYTYSNDKYSCMVEFWYAHMVLNYVVFLSGLVCLISRLIPAFNRYHIHAWSGRVYILAMLWTTAVSLLINNEGLPLAVLVSFAAVMGGLTLGWVVIVIHKQRITTQATQLVQTQLMEQQTRILLKKNENEKENKDETSDDTTTRIDLNTMLNDATQEIVNSKTFVQRFFSLKSLHGIVFFVSWMQISGRIFNDGNDGTAFSCRSFPVYKPIEAGHIPDAAFVEAATSNIVTLLPVHDPRWDALPWSNGPVSWSLLIILASAIVAVVGGIFFSCFFAWHATKSTPITRQTNDDNKKDSTKEKEERSNDDNDNTEEVIDRNEHHDL